MIASAGRDGRWPRRRLSLGVSGVSAPSLRVAPPAAPIIGTSPLLTVYRMEFLGGHVGSSSDMWPARPVVVGPQSSAGRRGGAAVVHIPANHQQPQRRSSGRAYRGNGVSLWLLSYEELPLGVPGRVGASGGDSRVVATVAVQTGVALWTVRRRRRRWGRRASAGGKGQSCTFRWRP